MNKKNIPKCPVNEEHLVKVNVILGKKYFHCKQCCEDIEFLAKKINKDLPPPLPKGVENLVYSLYLKDNPHTSFQTVHGVLTTMLGLDDLLANQVAQDCHDKGEAFILSRDSFQEADRLLTRANNWLNSHEPNSSANKKRNLIIEIREES